MEGHETNTAKAGKTRKGKKATRRGNHAGRLELRGNKWLAVWMVGGKRQSQSTGETDRAAAEKWLARKLESVRTADGMRQLDKDAATIQAMQKSVLGAALADIEARRREIEDGAPGLRFCDAWEAYVRTPKRKAITEKTLGLIKARFLRLKDWVEKKHPEAEELRSVTPKIAAEFAADVRAKVVPATYNIMLATYGQIWALLSAEIRGKVNPWTREQLPRLDAPESERRDITDEELARIFKAAQKEIPPLHYLFTVMLYTGARLGDCAKLQWAHVDLARGFLSFVPEKTRRFKTRVKIPILPPLRAMLESYPADRREGYIMPDMAAEYEAGRLSRTITRFFETKCGIATNKKTDVGKRRHAVVTAHSFRHTFISKAANAGIPFAIVQAIVGHSTAQQCRHYFHENEDATLRAFAAFPVRDAQTAALPSPASGEIIDAEIIEGEGERAEGAATPESRRAALAAILAEIEAEGGAAERKATADFLAARARELADK